MHTTIICLGNRLVPHDSAGPAVYDWLQKVKLPDNVSIVEGGTAGLNLLPLLEHGGRVIFVDAVSGFADRGTIVVLEAEDIVAMETPPWSGHEIGLPDVLSVLSSVCDGEPPEEILMIGIEGEYDSTLVQHAADLSLNLAGKGK